MLRRLLEYLDGKQHEARYGHWPNYYDVGAGIRVGGAFLAKVCVNCLKGGHRPPRYAWVGSRS